jgi:carbon-monoxide dehydrogenase medium subunit
VTDVRVACLGVGVVPVRAHRAEETLAGGPADEASIAAAARAAAAELEPAGDLHASAEFRRSAAEVLMARALREATQRARRNDDNGGMAG